MNVADFIITVIFQVIIFVIRIVLLPVDFMIATFAPDLTDAFQSIGDLLELIFQYIGWALSVSGISYFALSLVVSYWIFKLTLPINVWLVKLAIKWWRALKG